MRETIGVRIAIKSITEADLEFARELRNANRQWFCDAREVSRAQQREWFERLQCCPQVDFRLIYHGSRKVGTISAIDIAEGAELGNVIVIPEVRGQGFGIEAVSLMCSQYQNCFARIFDDNVVSQALFAHCGVRIVLLPREQ